VQFAAGLHCVYAVLARFGVIHRHMPGLVLRLYNTRDGVYSLALSLNKAQISSLMDEMSEGPADPLVFRLSDRW